MAVPIGYKLSDATKLKMSLARKGRKLSDEAKQKISLANKGRRHTDEEKRKMSERRKGLTSWRKGKTGICTEETKIKMRENHKGMIGYKHTEETKIKMRKAAGQGDKNHTWKGGKIINQGYIQIYLGKGEGYAFEHRLVMEEYLGRKLYIWEIVHHKNGVRSDNRIENLKVLPGVEHNTKVQKVFLENKALKEEMVLLKQKIINLKQNTECVMRIEDNINLNSYMYG